MRRVYIRTAVPTQQAAFFHCERHLEKKEKRKNKVDNETKERKNAYILLLLLLAVNVDNN